MASTIRLKRSSNVGFTPDSNTISLGELFLNHEDATLFFKSSNGRIYYLQATLMSYSYSSANVNGTILSAAQGNTTLVINTDGGMNVISNVLTNSINISLNLSDSFLSNSSNQVATSNAANAVYNVASLAYSQANTANSIANGSLNTINTQNANYTLTLNDIGDPIYHNTAGAITYTIPTFASVPFPLGATIRIISGFGSGTITIAPSGGVSLWLANSATANGNQTIAARIIGRLTHLEPNVWSLDKS